MGGRKVARQGSGQLVRHALGISAGIILGAEIGAAFIFGGSKGTGKDGGRGGVEVSGDMHTAVSILAGDAKAPLAGSGVRIGLAGRIEGVLIRLANCLTQPLA